MVDNELRRHPRLRIAAIAAMRTEGQLNPTNQALGSVIDMSRSGIGLQTGQPPMIGQVVHLRIALDDHIHDVRARTTRVEREGDEHFYRVGLDWNAGSEVELQFLDRVFEVIESQG